MNDIELLIPKLLECAVNCSIMKNKERVDYLTYTKKFSKVTKVRVLNSNDIIIKDEFSSHKLMAELFIHCIHERNFEDLLAFSCVHESCSELTKLICDNLKILNIDINRVNQTYKSSFTQIAQYFNNSISLFYILSSKAIDLNLVDCNKFSNEFRDFLKEKYNKYFGEYAHYSKNDGVYELHSLFENTLNSVFNFVDKLSNKYYIQNPLKTEKVGEIIKIYLPDSYDIFFEELLAKITKDDLYFFIEEFKIINSTIEFFSSEINKISPLIEEVIDQGNAILTIMKKYSEDKHKHPSYDGINDEFETNEKVISKIYYFKKAYNLPSITWKYLSDGFLSKANEDKIKNSLEAPIFETNNLYNKNEKEDINECKNDIVQMDIIEHKKNNKKLNYIHDKSQEKNIAIKEAIHTISSIKQQEKIYFKDFNKSLKKICKLGIIEFTKPVSKSNTTLVKNNDTVLTSFHKSHSKNYEVPKAVIQVIKNTLLEEQKQEKIKSSENHSLGLFKRQKDMKTNFKETSFSPGI